MQQSIGRKPTQIEKEAMQAICKLQDENRELRLEIGRLKGDLSWIEQQINRPVVSLLPLLLQDVKRGKGIREAIRYIRDGEPSPASRSQAEEVAE